MYEHLMPPRAELILYRRSFRTSQILITIVISREHRKLVAGASDEILRADGNRFAWTEALSKFREAEQAPAAQSGQIHLGFRIVGLHHLR